MNSTKFSRQKQLLLQKQNQNVNKPAIWPFTHGKRQSNRFNKLLGIDPPKSIKYLTQMQQILTKQIRDIDAALQKQNNHMKYHKGVLFALGVLPKLTNELHSCLRSSVDILQQGFYVWKIFQGQDNYRLDTSRLIKTPKHFAQQLMEKSISNIQKYDVCRYNQSVMKVRRRWDCLSQPKPNKTEMQVPRIRTEAQQQQKQVQLKKKKKFGLLLADSCISQDISVHFKYKNKSQSMAISTLQKQKAILSKLKPESTAVQSSKTERMKTLPDVDIYKNLSILSKYQAKIKTLSQAVQNQQSEPMATIEQLQRMLEKEAIVLSIWVPPSNYPQFIGVASLYFYQRNVQRVCIIKKYFWYRHSLNRKLFNCMLQWACVEFGQTDLLQLSTSKIIYKSVFSTIGWKINSWIGPDKLKITYSHNG